MRVTDLVVNPVVASWPAFEAVQLQRAKLIVSHLTRIRKDGDVSWIILNLPWFESALMGFDKHLRNQGFLNAYTALGQANAQAERVDSLARDWHEWDDHENCVSVALRWYRAGARHRDWFFSVVFDVEPSFSNNPHGVLFFSARVYDESGSLVPLTPSCLEPATK